MTDHTVTHASFTLKRSYKSNPARVFSAFAQQEQKGTWFADPGDIGASWSMDFSEGGLEQNVGLHEGHKYAFIAQYQDIVPEARIVYSYRMFVNDVKLSASLTTIEFEPEGTGTLLVFTEQGAFFDGHEDPKLRETGTVEILEALAAAID